jgi:hypothetical protein
LGYGSARLGVAIWPFRLLARKIDGQINCSTCAAVQCQQQIAYSVRSAPRGRSRTQRIGSPAPNSATCAACAQFRGAEVPESHRVLLHIRRAFLRIRGRPRELKAPQSRSVRRRDSPRSKLPSARRSARQRTAQSRADDLLLHPAIMQCAVLPMRLHPIDASLGSRFLPPL